MTSLARSLSALSRNSEVAEVAPYVTNPDPVQISPLATLEKGAFGPPSVDYGLGNDPKNSAHTVVGDAEAQERAKNIEYLEPGMKGWLDVAGAVVINMLCCKSHDIRRLWLTGKTG